MPYSSRAGKDWVRSRLSAAGEVSRVLDVGVGAGYYSDLFHANFPEAEWVGLEVWAPYVEQFGLQSKYNRLIICDARWIDFNLLGSFDVCFCGDVLEHMPAGDAQCLVDHLLQHARLLFISLPIGYYPKGANGGNPFERHIVDNYSDAAVRQSFPAIIDGWIETVDKWTLGVYALTRHETIADKLRPRRELEAAQ